MWIIILKNRSRVLTNFNEKKKNTCNNGGGIIMVERQFLRFTTRARFRLERLPLAGNVFPRVHFVPLMFAPFHPP